MFKSKKTFSEIVAPMAKPAAKKPNPFAKSAAPVMDDEASEPTDTAVRMVTGSKKKKVSKNPFAKGGSLISKGMSGKFGKC